MTRTSGPAVRILRGLTLAGSLLAVTAGASTAFADPVITVGDTVGGELPHGTTINEDVVPGPQLRPRSILHPVALPHGSVSPAVNTNIIYLNQCAGSGCVVRDGNTQSETSTSDIGHGTLQPFQFGATAWASVVSCMKTVYAGFDVTITDTQPTSGSYFEVMIAGTYAELGGQSSDVGGIADYPCGGAGNCEPYYPDALVFDFANASFYGTNSSNVDVNSICATAAQEIAHAFTLDHVVDNTDPMTYNEGFSGIRMYHNNEKCGSDCVGGQSPFGLTCSGSGGNATHTCYGTGTATQNEITTIAALFGTGTPVPPTVSITNPANGASVQAGFPVDVTANDAVGITTVVLKIDNAEVRSLNTAPYTFTAPTTLGQGSHTVQAIATNVGGLTATATVDVVIGAACTSAASCSVSTDTCVAGHCEPGPGVQGGLGTTCTANTDCASNQCGSDGNGNKYCVDSCDPTMSQCPSGFGCLSNGAGGGVCWPGAADSGGSGGGCDAGSNAGPLGLGLAFAALLFTRRRR